MPEGFQQRREGGNGPKDRAFITFIGLMQERRRRPEMKSGYARIDVKRNRRLGVENKEEPGKG